jgi:hypothetical protein
LRIITLEQDLIMAREEAENLRPHAERWLDLCARNKTNARRPRTRGDR